MLLLIFFGSKKGVLFKMMMGRWSYKILFISRSKDRRFSRPVFPT